MGRSNSWERSYQSIAFTNMALSFVYSSEGVDRINNDRLFSFWKGVSSSRLCLLKAMVAWADASVERNLKNRDIYPWISK